MILPFYVGHSISSPLLHYVIPAFDKAGHHDESSLLQLNATMKTMKADNLFLKFAEGSSFSTNLCLVPMLIALNLGFAFLMQYIAQRCRISEVAKATKASEDRYSALAALIRDLAGVQCIYFITRGWLSGGSYKWVARSLCCLTILHWFIREWTYAQFLSSLTADLTNSVVDLPKSKAPWTKLYGWIDQQELFLGIQVNLLPCSCRDHFEPRTYLWFTADAFRCLHGKLSLLRCFSFLCLSCTGGVAPTWHCEACADTRHTRHTHTHTFPLITQCPWFGACELCVSKLRSLDCRDSTRIR